MCYLNYTILFKCARIANTFSPFLMMQSVYACAEHLAGLISESVIHSVYGSQWQFPGPTEYATPLEYLGFS